MRMRNTIKAMFICAAILLLTAAPLWAQQNRQPQQGQQYYGPGYGPGGQGMGPGMMGPGYGQGHMGRGMGGAGMNPSQEGWAGMSPEQRQQWRQLRSQFMHDTLPLRQELNAKQMELQTLWGQPEPDQKRIKELSEQVSELRAKLDQEHDRYLSQCRQQFGDRGWACPGLGRGGY